MSTGVLLLMACCMIRLGGTHPETPSRTYARRIAARGHLHGFVLMMTSVDRRLHSCDYFVLVVTKMSLFELPTSANKPDSYASAFRYDQVNPTSAISSIGGGAITFEVQSPANNFFIPRGYDDTCSAWRAQSR